MAKSTAAFHNAAQDSNKISTLTLIGGTLGTADTTDSQLPIRAAGNPITGAQYVELLGSATITGGSNVNVVTGTQQRLGTVGTIENIVGGSIVVTGIPQVSIGTLPQVSVGTLPTISLSDYGTNVNIITGSLVGTAHLCGM